MFARSPRVGDSAARSGDDAYETVMTGRRQPFALALVAAAVSLQTGAITARTSPVSPLRGATTSSRPVFVATVAAGDVPEEVQIATSPAVTAIGFRTHVALCFPVRSGRGRVRCTSDTALKNGTYYWTLVYQSNSRCIVHGGKRYCFPEPHLTGPTRFTVRQ
jgi:hypothetical protein